MTNSLTEALIFVIDVFGRLYLLLLLLRILMPLLGVGYNNPLVQGILRLTAPLVVPMRRVIPPVGRIDTATLLLAFALQCLLIWVIAKLRGASIGVTVLLVASSFELITLTVNIFLFAILISVILSWLSANSYNPVVNVVHAISEPVLRPFRRRIPPMGGFDLSPIFAMVALGVVLILLGGVQGEVLARVS